MPWLITVFVLGAAAGAMVVLSHPEELRPGRIWKMAVSLPMLAIGLGIMAAKATNAFVAVGQVTFYVFFIGIPILFWTPNLAWYAGRGLTTLLQGSGRGGGGFRPEFGLVRSHLEEGNLKEALKLLEEELDKDRHNFEGLLLLAQLQLDRKQPRKAIAALQTIIDGPDTTEEQRALAVSEKKRLEIEFSKPAPSDAAPPLPPPA
jgi:tetratricopeptide (TPR) repeat protein